MSRRTKRTLLWAGAILLICAAYVVPTERAWHNQVSSCESGNPIREAVVLATETAAEHSRTGGNAAYRAAADKILAQPDIGPAGARDCGAAIPNPISLP